MNGTQIFELVTGMLSGLALFMFGMNVMSDTLTQLAGGKLESILGIGLRFSEELPGCCIEKCTSTLFCFQFYI